MDQETVFEVEEFNRVKFGLGLSSNLIKQIKKIYRRHKHSEGIKNEIFKVPRQLIALSSYYFLLLHGIQIPKEDVFNTCSISKERFLAYTGQLDKYFTPRPSENIVFLYLKSQKRKAIREMRKRKQEYLENQKHQENNN
ncbi:MAG: hypothetical protein JXA99_12525 [Candidatus Lokiarchaeota archaeon]|nr:hypothetical protein [Candidatus Lokiarchaeota archaeon]